MHKTFVILSIFGFTLQSFALQFQKLSCGAVTGTKNLEVQLSKPGYPGIDWEENTVMIDGNIDAKINDKLTLIPIKGVAQLTSKFGTGRTILDGQYKIFNPYFNKWESFHQITQAPYNEIYILQNRIHPENHNGFATLPGDILGFAVFCSHF